MKTNVSITQDIVEYFGKKTEEEFLAELKPMLRTTRNEFDEVIYSTMVSRHFQTLCKETGINPINYRDKGAFFEDAYEHASWIWFLRSSLPVVASIADVILGNTSKEGSKYECCFSFMSIDDDQFKALKLLCKMIIDKRTDLLTLRNITGYVSLIDLYADYRKAEHFDDPAPTCAEIERKIDALVDVEKAFIESPYYAHLSVYKSKYIKLKEELSN